MTLEEIKTKEEKQVFDRKSADIDAKQVFGAPEIQQILECSPTTSRAIMAKLRECGVLEVVNGNGKGRYVFKK